MVKVALIQGRAKNLSSMALSYYSNYGTLQQHLNPEMSIFTQAQPDLTPELLAFHDNFDISGTYVDPLFDPDELLYPYMSSPSQHSNSLTPEIFPPLELEPYHYPKRARTCQDVFVPNPQVQLPELSPELIAPLWEFESRMPVYHGGGSALDHESTAVKEGNGGGTLSVQSMAARKRRRKITEKTQELGKLIPGGQKLNTAEMFQAASKYIKFLRAQVGILELMSPNQEKKEAFHSEELHHLVASPLVREKCYLAEKCLVPKQFVQFLVNEPGIKANPQLLKDINQLL
ncbi:hypothetical protein RJ639_022744 [Escallonia herrerae]|uniref:BHLH domain-containing protein n=1 Tax=Escallonia herrerae TaxID=1293975 RepID=A0AA88V1I3_9ASTE|nr:hypothetical protein RJ639_022744 [Escallonia herrerae]